MIKKLMILGILILIALNIGCVERKSIEISGYIYDVEYESGGWGKS